VRPVAWALFAGLLAGCNCPVTALTPHAIPVLPPTPVPQPLMTHKEDVLSITLASLYDTDLSVRAAGTHAVVAILKIKRVLKRDEVG